MTGKTSSHWKGGISERYKYGNGFTPKIKKLIFDRDGGKCRVCKSTFRLAVHHRNGIKTQNVKNNLILLCGKCHFKIHRQFECYITKKYMIKENKLLNQFLIEKMR